MQYINAIYIKQGLPKFSLTQQVAGTWLLVSVYMAPVVDLQGSLPADVKAVGIDDHQSSRDDPGLAVDHDRFVAFEREPFPHVVAKKLSLFIFELHNR